MAKAKIGDNRAKGRQSGSSRRRGRASGLDEPRIDAAPLAVHDAIPEQDREQYGYVEPRRHPNGVAAALIALAALVLVAGSIAVPLWGVSGTDTTLVDRTLPGSALALDAGGADVTVSAWNGQGIRVRAIQHGDAQARYTIHVATTGNQTVQVYQRNGPCFLFCRRSLRYAIEVPRGAGVRVGTSSGVVLLRGLGGALQVKTASGGVTLSSGQATAADVATSSGDVSLDGVAHRVVVRSASGNIYVDHARDGTIALSASSGNINYSGSLASSGANTVRSVSGNVTVSLPSATRVRVVMDTASGNMRNDFAKGSTAAGGATLHAQTASGNISVEKH